MAKKQTMLTIDFDVVEQCKFNRLNMSQISEDALRSTLGIISGNTNSINIQLSRKKLHKIEEEISQKTLEATKIREAVRLCELKLEKDQEKALEEEKKKIEEQKKCVSCGNIIPEGVWSTKTHSGKQMCKSCLFSGKDPTKM